MSKAISEVFDVTPVRVSNAVATVDMPEDDTVSDDAKFVRGNMRELIKTGTDALSEALEVAIQSESPRAYEVVTGLITAMGDLNNKLLATHQLEQKAAVNKSDTVNTQNNVTNNNVIFTGTPAELAKLIQQQRNTP